MFFRTRHVGVCAVALHLLQPLEFASHSSSVCSFIASLRLIQLHGISVVAMVQDMVPGAWNSVEEVIKLNEKEWRANWRSALPFFRWTAEKKLGRVAFDTLQLLREWEVPVNAFHVSIALKACKDWQLAMLLLFNALHSSDDIDDVAFNSLINVCKATGQWAAAIAVLWEMSGCMPCNSRSCSTAIAACERANQWRAALLVLDSMAVLSVEQEVFSYTAAISACAGIGLWREALDLWRSLRESSVKEAEVTYNTLLTACGNGHEWQLALLVLETAMSEGKWSAVTSNAAIFACGEGGSWQSSLLVLGQMRLWRLVETSSFNSAGTACARNTQWQAALEAFQNCRDEAKIDAVSLAVAAYACDMGVQWPLALSFLDEATERRVVAAQCYTSAINAGARDGNWLGAMALLEAMDENGIKKGPKSFGAALSACCQSEAWPVALELLNLMSIQDVTPAGCHVGSVAEVLTKVRGSESTRALLEHFREVWLEQSPVAQPCERFTEATFGRLLNVGSHIIAVQKPAGIRTEALLQEVEEAFFPQAFSLVSRLDLPTSGVLPIVVGDSNSPPGAWYQACFAGRLVTKEYLCLCRGPSLGAVGTKGVIKLPLTTRHLTDGGVLAAVSEAGRAAETEYEVVERFEGDQDTELMLLRVHPLTGRTHQIRVHLAALGRPLVGDATYGGETCHRLFLHCHEISIPDFTAGAFSAKAELPLDLQAVLKETKAPRRRMLPGASSANWRPAMLPRRFDSKTLRVVPQVSSLQARYDRQMGELLNRGLAMLGISPLSTAWCRGIDELETEKVSEGRGFVS